MKMVQMLLVMHHYGTHEVQVHIVENLLEKRNPVKQFFFCRQLMSHAKEKIVNNK